MFRRILAARQQDVTGTMKFMPLLWSPGSEDCAILVKSFQLSAISSQLDSQAGSDAG
jgi:hypothetical protein